jgi:hypothetical protein
LLNVPLRKAFREGHYRLTGREGAFDAYLCETLPRESLIPQKHMYEEIIHILSGYGATTPWVRR